ncbi:uncharacterized protein LOC114120460 isoform X2 [Aphis gossypii]|uniref:uncharacterized protein LOC114120460 isoform X2 n=1 Tax=Aphis gossypii TaxID=80765 RepID=UPI002158E622|nr:uncharacterized protein LOC114120460 isoform X2 [Aphis gossypii]
MAEKKGDELKNTEKEQHKLFPTKLAQDGSLIVNLLQSRTIDREPRVVVEKPKADNAELEKNENIFKNNNNIQYKFKLNPLAKEFSMTMPKSDSNENLVMELNSTRDNISKPITVNNAASNKSDHKRNECVENKLCIPKNTFKLNPLAKEFIMPMPKSDSNENHITELNNTRENISKPTTVNNAAPNKSDHKRDECVENKVCIPTNTFKLNPLAKEFIMPMPKSDSNENHITELNAIRENISKPITVNNAASNKSDHKRNECVENKLCIPKNTFKLNPLAKEFIMPMPKSDSNENHITELNNTRENISKPTTVNNAAPNKSDHKRDECVENKVCIPTNTFKLNPLAKEFIMPMPKSDSNENHITELNAIRENISKPTTVNNAAPNKSDRKRDECVENKVCIPNNTYKLNLLEKEFIMPMPKCNSNENHITELNATRENISKPSSVNNVALNRSDHKRDECVENKVCIPNNTYKLNLLEKEFIMPMPKCEPNENLVMELNSSCDNISKQVKDNDVVQNGSNRQRDESVETLSCIPPHKFTLNTMAKKRSISIHKSDSNKDLVMDLSSISNKVPTQLKQNEENFGQHSFNHIMDVPPEISSSRRKSKNWIVRFFTYCLKKLSFKTRR